MENERTHFTQTGRVWPEKGMDGAALKWIAMWCMLIDHIGAVVLEYGLFYQGGAGRMEVLLEQPWGVFLYPLSLFLRILGRPAFPIYCFLLTGSDMEEIFFCSVLFQKSRLIWQWQTGCFILHIRMCFLSFLSAF